MIANICFFFSISSGSALAAVLWKKGFGDILPITISSITLFLFLGGVVGYLEESFWIVAGTTFLIWFLVVFFLLRKQNITEVWGNFFDGSFWVFLFI